MVKFSEYINEASSLSSLGATKEQIKFVYSRIKEFRTTVTVNASAKFVQKQKKKEVTDIMRSTGIDSAVVVGFADTMMFYTIQTEYKNYDNKKDEYITYQIDQFGNEISNWIENSAIKALSYHKGVKVYNIAEKGATVAKATTDHGYDNPVDGNDIALQFSNLIENDMEKLFKEAKVKFSKKISSKIDSGDLVGAKYMLDKVVVDKSESWSSSVDYVEKQFAAFLIDGWENSGIYQQIKNTLAKDNQVSTSGWGWVPRVSNLTQNSSKNEIRFAAAKVLKLVKEKIANILAD